METSPGWGGGNISGTTSLSLARPELDFRQAGEWELGFIYLRYESVSFPSEGVHTGMGAVCKITWKPDRTSFSEEGWRRCLAGGEESRISSGRQGGTVTPRDTAPHRLKRPFGCA